MVKGEWQSVNPFTVRDYSGSIEPTSPLRRSPDLLLPGTRELYNAYRARDIFLDRVEKGTMHPEPRAYEAWAKVQMDAAQAIKGKSDAQLREIFEELTCLRPLPCEVEGLIDAFLSTGKSRNDPGIIEFAVDYAKKRASLAFGSSLATQELLDPLISDRKKPYTLEMKNRLVNSALGEMMLREEMIDIKLRHTQHNLDLLDSERFKKLQILNGKKANIAKFIEGITFSPITVLNKRIRADIDYIRKLSEGRQEDKKLAEQYMRMLFPGVGIQEIRGTPPEDLLRSRFRGNHRFQTAFAMMPDEPPDFKVGTMPKIKERMRWEQLIIEEYLNEPVSVEKINQEFNPAGPLGTPEQQMEYVATYKRLTTVTSPFQKWQMKSR